MERRFLFLASLAGGLAVTLGAFGAHGLKGRLDPALVEFFDVGVRYHMYHALALRRGCSKRQGIFSTPGWRSSPEASISSP